MPRRRWTFLTNHAAVLLHVACHPEDTIRSIAHELGLAERTVAGVLADLRAAGYLTTQRVGKRNLYSVNGALPMRSPFQSQYAVQEFFPALGGIGQERRYPDEERVCVS